VIVHSYCLTAHGIDLVIYCGNVTFCDFRELIELINNISASIASTVAKLLLTISCSSPTCAIRALISRIEMFIISCK
jgi:hypothetical protein